MYSDAVTPDGAGLWSPPAGAVAVAVGWASAPVKDREGVAAGVIIRHLVGKDGVSLLRGGIGPNGRGMARIGSFGVWCGLGGGRAQSASRNVARSLARLSQTTGDAVGKEERQGEGIPQ